MSTGAVRPLRHLAPLDGLRGLAILAVVFHNTVDALIRGPDHLARVLALLAGPGWIGVQLFFALSGFLIAGELLDHRQARNYLRAFYARRALRILPLYYATLVLVVAVTALLSLHAVGSYLRADGWQLGLFVNNFARPPPVGFGHFWSLAVEVQFYALVPWLVGRMRAPRLAVTCLWIAVGVLAVRTMFAWSGTGAWTIYSGTIFRLDALALGVAGACFVRIEPVAALLPKYSGSAFLLAAAILLFGALTTHTYDYSRLAGETFGYTLAAVASGLVVLFAAAPPAAGQAQKPWIRPLSFLPLRLVGRYSYGIYLFHNLLNHFVGVPVVRHLFPTSVPGKAMAAYSAAMFIVSFILAALSFEFFERRFLRVKPRFQTRPAAAEAALQTAPPAPVSPGALAPTEPLAAD